MNREQSTMTGVGGRTTVRRTGGSGPAWAAFARTVRGAPGYAAHLARFGVDPATVSRWTRIPFTDRTHVFGDAVGDWMVEGDLTGAAELVCSSGQSGPPFALGVTVAADQDAMRQRVDHVLAALGTGADSPTLLVNTLPMGITVPSRLATVATPSVHMEMAQHLLAHVAPRFDRVLLIGEPLYLSELARRARRDGAVHPETWVITGGEPVAEAWRTDLCRVLDAPQHRVSISMGAAEVGLHLLFETPQLAAARARVAAQPSLGDDLWGDLCDGAYAPTLLTFDPARLLVEARRRRDGGPPRLVVTTLGEVALPLIRYDLGDIALVLDDAAVAALADRTGTDLSGGVVALAGRSAWVAAPGGRRVRPEAVREWLFADPHLADDLTGRFTLRTADAGVLLDLQARGEGEPTPPAREALAALGDRVAEAADAPVRVHRYACCAYPFHPAGDWTHKAVYVR